MLSFGFKRSCPPRWNHPAPPTPRPRSERSGAALRDWWGTVSKKVGHHYEPGRKSAPLPVETAPHLRRNRAPLPVEISAPFRPESATLLGLRCTPQPGDQAVDLVQRSRKCLFLYQYWQDPELGWMNARIQTWCPFSIQMCLNGREWLARQMKKEGIGYRKQDNCFVWVEDWERAQRLLEVFLPTRRRTKLGTECRPKFRGSLPSLARCLSRDFP